MGKADIVNESNENETNSFVDIYDIYFDKINRYLRYRVRDTWDADDLTAQVFTKAFEKFHQCRNPEKVGAWIFRIAHTTYVDYLRKRKEHLPLDDYLVKASELEQPEESALADEEILELKKCMEQLSQEQRDVILLRYFGDLKYQQIAQVLGKKDATVKTMGYRALQKLRSLWHKQDS